jgi:hypothetical protein
MATMDQPAPDDSPTERDYGDPRFRRWYVCPVVGCHHIEENDIREKGAAHYCPSDQHPSTPLKIFFGGRLLRT